MAKERKVLYIFSFLIFSLLLSFVSRQKKANSDLGNPKRLTI